MCHGLVNVRERSGIRTLLYKVLLDLTVLFRLYTNSLSALFESDFVELYKFVEEVYENSFHYRLSAMAW